MPTAPPNPARTSSQPIGVPTPTNQAAMAAYSTSVAALPSQRTSNRRPNRTLR